jgi:regulatory protein
VRRQTRRPKTAREPESAEAAYQEAVRRLARQPQSRAMLGERLRHAGFADDAVDSALDLAQAHGYLNDREFAEAVVRRRAGSRGQAMIAQELRAKGVDEAALEPALRQVDPDAELDQALQLGRTLLARRRLPDGEALLTFLAPKLSRRGFASGVTYRVCRLLASEWQAAGLFDS